MDWLNGFHSQEGKIQKPERVVTSEEGDAFATDAGCSSSFLAVLMAWEWLAFIPTAPESSTLVGAGCLTPNPSGFGLVWAFTSPPAIALTIRRRPGISSNSKQTFHHYYLPHTRKKAISKSHNISARGLLLEIRNKNKGDGIHINENSINSIHDDDGGCSYWKWAERPVDMFNSGAFG